MGFNKETLKKLCCSNGWSYGVLWHFDQRNSMLLTVEDSYCEEKMAALVNNMILRVQMLGEGIVGQAALTGKNQWIFTDFNNGRWSSMAQDDVEIQSQFTSGLKTIAVIPIDSRGVMQFGSIHKILETSEFLDQTKRLFNEVEDMNGISFSDNLASPLKYDNCDLNEWFDSFCNGNITPLYSGNYNELMDIAYTSTDFTHLTSESESQLEKMESFCLDSAHLNPNSQFQQSDFSVENLASEIPCFSTWSNQDSFLTSLDSIESFKLDDFDAEHFVADNVFEWFSSTQGPANLLQNPAIEEFGCGNLEKSIHMNNVGNDPLKGFGVQNPCGKSAESLSSGRSSITTGVSQCLSNLNYNPVNNGPKKGLFSELGLEELLNGGTNSSYITNSRIGDQFSNAKRRRLENPSVCCGGTSNETTLEVFPKSKAGLWIDDSYSINNGPNVLAKPKKHEEPTQATRKRAKPGESTRPRPKDRQMIQDRMKELKELIPDGAKCSIDALLDRTVKYMIFLQSVTKYADKIKNVDQPKLIGGANRKISKENTSGKGATWAIEVGDQSMVCPIIVEDLTTPGLMLIEMLCEDRGFFLEIADVIRGFGLNVLKGEMESREDKIWARFIVEAKMNITRIDVFWSLVQLLQLTSTTGIDSTNQPMSSSQLDPHLNGFKEPPLPCPISVAETLQ